MKVFISWSGAHAKQVAGALRGWLPLVIQSLSPWMSDSDIHAGERWGDVIQGELERSNFGIICVTPDNQKSPWLNFEAGALSKVVEHARVVPLLHGLTFPNMISGPLQQFHAKELNKRGVWELIQSINNSLSVQLQNEILARTFEVMWPQLETALSAIELTPQQEELANRPQEDKVDEILYIMREREGIERDALCEISKDLAYLIKGLDSTGVLGDDNVVSKIMRASSMQIRAFIKVARIDVDEESRTVTLRYDKKSKFHFNQMKVKKQELQDALNRVSAKSYKVIILGPDDEFGSSSRETELPF